MTRQEVRVRGMGPAPGPYPRLPEVPDPRSLEREVLRRWRDRDVFARSLARTSGGPRWTCAGDPPAASGMPGVHHVPDLAVRDLYQRYKQMRGCDVPRPISWNCHGLAVEVAVERELGLSGRSDIDRYGVGRFAERCRESVIRHVKEQSALIERIGHWANLAEACQTMDPSYVESVWACVYRIFGAGLLVRQERIVPYCPRCQTNLSEHELTRPASRRTIAADAVTVRFPVASLPGGMNPWLTGADLLVCTDAPWTLMAIAGIAAHPHQTYAVARRAGHDDRVVVADAAVGRVLGEGWHVVARVSGADLAGLGYLPHFGSAAEQRVVTANFVTTDTGTGLAHLAPAFSEEELEACRAHGLAPVSPIGPDGRFDPDVPVVGGAFFRAADPILVRALADRGALFAAERTERGWPHCWRCGTALLSRSLPAWYVKTSAVKDQLLARDQRTTWVPAPVGPGNEAGWLRREADWALSRTRYWGTPLPIWECERGHLACVPSRARLSELADRDLSAIEPHRPAIDEVVFACPECGGMARRVPEVIDDCFDAGAMPFARGRLTGLDAPLDEGDPAGWLADLVTETADEGGGWLFALMTVGTLLAGGPASCTALCLGAVLDGDGTAMSRDRGNLAAPLPLIDQYGADALRWYFTAASPPSAARRVTGAALDEVVGKVLLGYWDCVAFFVTQANAAALAVPLQAGAAAQLRPAERPPLDRWLLSELQSLVTEVTHELECTHSAAAGRRIAEFIDELRGWYLHPDRGRFTIHQADGDRAAALATLRECLDVLTRLMAPIVPFLADYVWDVIRGGAAPDSVHLARWPAPVAELADPGLAGQMALARRIADIGRSARAAAMIRVSQPLARALVSASAFAELDGDLLELVARELNVKSVGRLPSPGATGPYATRPGGTADGLPADAADGVPVPAHAATIPEHSLADWAVAVDGGETVALDVAMTPELHREGLAREVIRLVRDAREADGLAAADPIALRWSAADGELASALVEFGPMISADVGAADYGPAEPGDCPGTGAGAHHDAELGVRLWIRALPTP